jgi:hypothetical protein
MGSVSAMDSFPIGASAAIGIASFLASIFGSAIVFGWRSRGMYEELRENIRVGDDEIKKEFRVGDIELKIRDGLVEVREDFRLEHDEFLKRYGEAMAAVREQLNRYDRDLSSAQLWNRDNFVKQPVVDAIVQSIASLRSETNASFDRMRTEMQAGNKDILAHIERLRESRPGGSK